MALFNIFGNSEVIYFPGCYSSAFLQNKIENYKKILKKLGINFSMSKDISCCGGVLDEAGYEKQLRKLARDNQSFLESKKTKKIITGCPLCLQTLSNYKDLIPNCSIETEFILQTVFNNFINNPELIRNHIYETVAYYDSCYLARHLKLIEIPRDIIKMIGYQIIELPKTREETICCGSCGGLIITNPELADKICTDFIRILRRKKIKRIVTADSRAYYHLKKNLKAMQIYDEEIEVLEISDLICNALGIQPE